MNSIDANKKAPKRFGELMKRAYYSIQAREHGISRPKIDEQLAKKVGLSEESVRGWRFGKRTPATCEDMERLTRELVRRGQMDRIWFKGFVTSGGYPELKNTLGRELYPDFLNQNSLTERLSETSSPINIEEQTIENPLSWSNFQHICHIIQSISIENIERKYDPDLYIGRSMAEEVTKNFLNSNRNILVITGKSGIGKTRLTECVNRNETKKTLKIREV